MATQSNRPRTSEASFVLINSYGAPKANNFGPLTATEGKLQALAKQKRHSEIESDYGGLCQTAKQVAASNAFTTKNATYVSDQFAMKLQ